VPQACVRTNTAGNCIGERTCMQGNDRFSDCNATAPQCLTDCSMQNPAGCMESYCAAATSGPTDCGACGTVCPGYMVQFTVVTCNTSQMCTFACSGENYDVDGNPANGCEVVAAPQGNHTDNPPASPPVLSTCDDGDLTALFSGHLPSDARVHEEPAIVGFDATTGSAPDWFYVTGQDTSVLGTCESDVVMQLTMTGSLFPSCYHLLVKAGTNTYTCQTNATGSCPAVTCPGTNIPAGICYNSGGQFPGGSIIQFEVSKTCGTNMSENASFTIYGHL
jgi:hypothetical protein